MSKEEVFFTEEAGISGKLRKAESGEEAAGKRRPILWRVKVYEIRHIHCRGDSGYHETTGPILQVILELLVEFH